jgi:hypothetical protein
MPQLEEDEWPKTDQPTTTEQEDLKDTPEEPARDGTRSDYPPKLPPEALPTKD